MTEYPYKTIVKSAKTIKNNVEKEYKLGATAKWSYYFAKCILNPKKDVHKTAFNNAPKPTGTHLSRQIPKADYLKICERLIDYVERKRGLPNFITYKSFKIRTRLYTYMMAKILVYYDAHGQLPNYVDINSKAFYKPTETGNTVYDYFYQKTGKKYTTIDDFLEYIKAHYTYEFYFDDHKSNKEVIDSKAGNCTDLLQMMCNYVEAMGYEWKCIHVKCRQSGTGHVFGKFRKKGVTDWFIRDIASVADGGSVISVWCRDGTILAENPQWFLANLHR
jgi:hypothetical protein